MALENIDGIVCRADDIFVYGIGDTYKDAVRDHDSKLIKLLERCREKGIKLNKDKVAFRQKEVTFVDHKISDKGLMADPLKVETIVEMEAPKDATGVQRLSGMVNYLSRYLPKLSDVMEPIKKITHKDVEWTWTYEHDAAFAKLKYLITKTPIIIQI